MTSTPGRYARVLNRRKMAWDALPPAHDDTPPHVRAASGVGWLWDRLVVIQDDTSFFALVDPETALALPIALPHHVGGRRRFEARLGNKGDKLDLEALVWWRDIDGAHVLAIASGSTAARRRWVHGIQPAPGRPVEVHLIDAGPVYDALRAEVDFAGAELNIEGAALDVAADTLWLVQRGNGRPTDTRAAVDAVVAFDMAAIRAWLAGAAPPPCPRSETIRSYALGALDGVRLTFTDATLLNGRLCFLACAEDSPDTYDDGRVAGSVVGNLAEGGEVAVVLPLVDPDGHRLIAKTEGIVAGRKPGRAWVVVDMDDPDVAAELWEVDVSPLLA